MKKEQRLSVLDDAIKDVDNQLRANARKYLKARPFVEFRVLGRFFRTTVRFEEIDKLRPYEREAMKTLGQLVAGTARYRIGLGPPNRQMQEYWAAERKYRGVEPDNSASCAFFQTTVQLPDEQRDHYQHGPSNFEKLVREWVFSLVRDALGPYEQRGSALELMSGKGRHLDDLAVYACHIDAVEVVGDLVKKYPTNINETTVRGFLILRKYPSTMLVTRFVGSRRYRAITGILKSAGALYPGS